MFARLRQLFGTQDSSADEGLTQILAWAQRAGYKLKRVRDAEGWVLEGHCKALAGMSWRLEWGAPQRAYIPGPELRMRMDLGLPEHVHLMLLTESLREGMESETFTEWTRTNQTLMDVAIPEEMRWLAFLPRVDVIESPRVRARTQVFASHRPVAVNWLRGEFSDSLQAACDGILEGDAPAILITLRGRLYFRVLCAEPDVSLVRAAVNLFECAAISARRAVAEVEVQSAEEVARVSEPEDWAHSEASAWNSGLADSDLQTLPMPEPKDSKPGRA